MFLSSQRTAFSFAWRLAAFYAALFVVLGVQLPFLPVWLAARDLDAGEIGLVLAIPMTVRVVAIPLTAHAADRWDALRAVLMIAAAAAVVGYALLGLAQGVIAIAIAFVLASACYTPMLALADAYAVRGLSRESRYGPVRLWGSAAFIAGSFAAGSLLDVIAPDKLIWLLAAAMLLTFLAACALAPLNSGTGGRAHAELPSASAPWLQGAFLAVAVAGSLVQASHAIFYGFATLDWQAAGLDGMAIGGLWALAVLAEIALFALSGRLSVDPAALLGIGAIGAMVRWGAMAFDPPLWLLPPLQCLHALSFGATHLGALAFLAQSTPAALAASAQAYVAVVQGLVMAAAMALSGVALCALWRRRLCGYGASCRSGWCLAVGFASTMAQGSGPVMVRAAAGVNGRPDTLPRARGRPDISCAVTGRPAC